MTNASIQELAPPEGHLPVLASPAEQFLAMVERASRDPSMDVAKLKELMGMYREVANKVAEDAFNTAMAQAQAEMEPVRANAENDQTHSKYATYAQLDRALRPIYTRHGFALSFNTEPREAGPTPIMRIVCLVAHTAGFVRRHEIDMPADGLGAKGGAVMTKTHAAGSAVQYGMRYLMKMIFNIAVAGDHDDDDGNGAGSGACITIDQQTFIRDLIRETRSDESKFLRLLKVRSLSEIPSANYQVVVSLLEAKRK